MAKAIITQNGTIINYDRLLAVYVDEDLDDEEIILGYDLVGVTGAEKDAEAILLGSYPDEESAENAKANLLHWLQTEAFSTFAVPAAEKGGEV